MRRRVEIGGTGRQSVYTVTTFDALGEVEDFRLYSFAPGYALKIMTLDQSSMPDKLGPFLYVLEHGPRRTT